MFEAKAVECKLVARRWEPQDLLDDLQLLIDVEPDRYLNDRRTTLCMTRDYLKEYFDSQKNEPLTAEDLWKMEGEPVWVKVIDKSVFADPRDAFDDWGFVRFSWVRMWDKSRADIVTVKHVFEDYGKTWVAYRRKPETDSMQA